ncbi:MAG: radical SAM family heme chaperone HemW [Firmicutes bacterium]|nr:radical SAM family heme chaperone HemW [Bacillota bacterium]
MPENLGIYIHIPFCLSKCAYCDFYSVTSQEDFERYVDALLLHMEDYSESAKNRVVDTVFIGGGTPTVLPKKTMLALIEGIYHNFAVAPDAEFTIESNPATVSLGELKQYLRQGVNRLSIGMQSACDNELRALSRIHTAAEFEKSYAIARKAGFKDINIDVMYGIPEQTKHSLMSTIEKVCEYEPEHVSLYGLKIEENTPFAAMADTLELPDEDTEYDMYVSAIERLREAGYEQYEISNFAKHGFRCAHNLKYWNCNEYLGFGAGAHSYYNGRRFSFRRDIAAYIDALEHPENGVDITDENYEIKPSERVGEYVMLRLRLCDGIDTDDFAEKFGLSFERIFGKYLSQYTENGFMTKSNGVYSFTTKGMYVSSYILSTMLDFNSDILAGIADGSDK